MAKLPVATICVPWRPSPSRLKPYAKIREYWATFFPDWPLITADAGGEIFNLAASRNKAVSEAVTDIVVVADADTVPPTDSVTIAVADPVGVCWPHEVWRLIPGEYAERPFEDFPAAPTVQEYPGGLGAVMVTTVDEYWRLGGQPEEFEGWGHEDRAFHCVVTTLSIHRRIGGVAYSIDHDGDSPGWTRDGGKRNARLARPYEQANGRPWLMRELLRQRDEPLPEDNDPTQGRYTP
jgi:hypothetical protein